MSKAEVAHLGYKKMADCILGKTYEWNGGVVKFIADSVLITTWEIGTYAMLGSNRVSATWCGLSHTMTFNADYMGYTSIRDCDGVIVTGNIQMPSISKIPSIFVDYKQMKSDLCELGRIYNVDKSSQRENPGPADWQHCHPYSLLYDALFRRRRADPINFCEIGIAEGRSLLMWNDYFPNAAIYGFEYLPRFLDAWAANHGDKERIHVHHMDVRSDHHIVMPLQKTGVQFDCIIDDSSHVFGHMTRIIRVAHPFLKEGGMLIIEDIRRAYEESWFDKELVAVANVFEHVFFVTLDHARRNSGTVQNDKMLILIKKGSPIFDRNLI